MSFRGDDSRRYGHVPPAQYPVANQSPDPNSHLPRRSSFNNGDDSSFFDRTAQPPSGYPANAGRSEDELFMTSSDQAQQARPAYNANQGAAMAGYQHQYQTPPTPTHAAYNPQNFPRSQSQSLPYHPHPASNRYGATPGSPTYGTQPTNFTPQAYNPAAYAATNTAVPQRTATVAGYNNFGYSYSSPAVPQVSSSGYAQTQPGGYGVSQPQPPMSTPPVQQGYSPSLSSPQYPPTSTPSSQYDQSYSQNYPSGSYFGGSYSDGANAAQSSGYGSAASQVPYPTHSQIPVGPNYDPNSFVNRTSRANSHTSPAPSPPVYPQASPGLQRHPTNAPLPSRPIEDAQDDLDWDSQQNDTALEQVTQDSLIQDIVSDLGVSTRPRPINGNVSDDDMERLRRYDSTASTINHQGDGVNRFASNASTVNRNEVPSTFDWDEGDESDPEGAAGLQLMQEDMDDRRFSAMTFPSYMEPSSQTQPQAAPVAPALPPPAEEQEQSTDSDFGGMDLGLYGGGYAGNLQYGNEVGSPPPTATSFDGNRPLPTPGSQDYPQYSQASVDYSGTGGLQDPQRTQRLSFDEGDERVSLHSRQSGSSSPYKEDYPDMFYHPGLSNRPLPALPPASDSSSMLSVQQASRGTYQHGYSLSADSRLAQDGSQQHVERSISLSSHSHTPQVQAPARSRTDAAEERRRAHKQMNQQQQAQQGVSPDGYETGTPTSLPAYDLITLPTGRRRKFIPSKLTVADIKRCAEPWALSGITSWVREMAEGEPDLKRKTIEEGLVKLFCTKVPTMNVADAESLSETVVDSMFAAGILIPEEEWVKFGPGVMSGVLWQLTGSGCYASKVHEDEEKLAPRLNDKNGIPVRCYSHHCGRTLKKANLETMMSEDDDNVVDWATFYGLTLKDTEVKPKKEVERQNNLHEIVTGEEDFMSQLDVLRLLYRDQLRAWQPPIIAANRLDKFLEAVFGKVDAVQQINREYLLAQLKYRQKEQGPWIVGFSDIFREWIRKARPVYIEYSSGFGYANFLIRKEASRNLLFRQFLDMVREHKRSKRLDWGTFVKAPITRLQRYSLLLEVAKKNMVGDSEEKTNLEKAIEEIKAVTRECDDKVHEEEAKVELLELQSRLVLRPGFQSALNLDHLGRKLLCQGELTRQGSKGVRWVDSHVILFDHYLILAKVIGGREGKGEKKYDVSKEPIPMPLLFLESKDDDPVTKQKGLATPLARTTAVTGSGTQLNKVLSSSSDRPALEHTATSSSLGSLNNAVTRLTPSSSKDENILYPFRVKHLGHEVYTLYALTQQDRLRWTKSIVEAKTAHARALHAQNAEPFRLRVLSDGAFSYDTVTAAGRQPGVAIRGTPLDRSIREMEKVYGTGRGPPPVCRAQVNCATAFNAYGKSIIAIGTDFGVFISEASNPRGWTRSLQMNKVTQIAVLEEFSVCIVIADKALVSIPLETIAPVSNFPAPLHDNPKKAPVKLAKDVAFFAAAVMKDRVLLFYKRKEGMHNTFKVLEPVFQKATEKRTKLFGGRRGGSGNTETFRDYDEFYLPTECYSLNLFQTYIAVASAKGFELLTLDKKIPQSIPHDLSLPAIANIASRIRDQRPLGMFKLNDQEFLLAYEDCAVYVDKHGEVSRTLIMEYSGKQKKAKGATMFGQYLLLFNEDYVEVRNAENGRLRQIIAGRDVRCLDYGFRGPTGNATQQPGPQDSQGTVKICMSHPEVAGGQIVLEMLLNDGHTEKA
ncbi:hypothetical protein GQ53DRAFT_831291 [Thozetella sp. PMI_491]|nr:hypothetical protein GQ53DRAFT_831291 [Thozetella sp. PMI_491]